MKDWKQWMPLRRGLVKLWFSHMLEYYAAIKNEQGGLTCIDMVRCLG